MILFVSAVTNMVTRTTMMESSVQSLEILLSMFRVIVLHRDSEFLFLIYHIELTSCI